MFESYHPAKFNIVTIANIIPIYRFSLSVVIVYLHRCIFIVQKGTKSLPWKYCTHLFSIRALHIREYTISLALLF